MFSMAEKDCGFAPLVFRLRRRAPRVVREVLLERGWVEYDKDKQEEGDWNLYWRSSSFQNSHFRNILPWQRLNHHLNMTHITNKENLERHLRRMKFVYGAALYDFSPAAFILPNEHTKFLGEYSKDRTTDESCHWICKPVNLSRGRGIFLFKDIKGLVYDSLIIVQKYISNPLLISGYKFDLRIYVCVKSFCPLVIYMHQEGLVRFATEKYTLGSLDNRYSHLTNTSINKFGRCYAKDKEQIGQGCKWTMSQFRRYLRRQDVDQLLFWHRISNIITLTLLTAVPCTPSNPNCLELLGFDILVDSSYKPWLLEVNRSPALSLDCPADVTVKKELISDIIDLMNYKMTDGFRKKENATPSGKRTWKRSSSSSSSSQDKLPSHHIYKLKSPTVPSNRETQDRDVPPCRVEDFILTFPFNEATWKASQDQDVKTIVKEVRELTNRLRSFSIEKRRTMADSIQINAGTDKFEFLLWGPTYPPLLSECYTSNSETK